MDVMTTSAWQTANFTRAKRLPSLKKVLGRDKPKKLKPAEARAAMEEAEAIIAAEEAAARRRAEEAAGA